MELRHLRYFIAVAEEGSLTLAAERRLHTAQPSLSRQIRDLETEIGVKLFARGARGIELTEAGRVYLDHARLALLQVEAAGEAARRVTRPRQDAFVVGFLAGQEMMWLPETLRLLHSELPDVDVRLLSQSSPDLAGALLRGSVDIAFIRREDRVPGLAFKLLIKEQLVLVLPRDHRLAAQKAIHARDLAGERFVKPTKAAPIMKAVTESYETSSGVTFQTAYEADNLSTAIALVASTGSLGLLPASARHLLPASVVSRPLKGDVPTIDLVVGYSKANISPLLKRFLAKVDELVDQVSQLSNR